MLLNGKPQQHYQAQVLCLIMEQMLGLEQLHQREK